MFFWQGDKFSLEIRDKSGESRALTHGIGLVLDGTWRIGSRTFREGDAFQVHGLVDARGMGTLAYAADRTPYDSTDGSVSTCSIVIHDKPWGWEHEVIPEMLIEIQLKELMVTAGDRTSEQYHVHKDEVMHILEGNGTITPPPGVGERHVHVAPGAVHRVAGPLRYAEASTRFPDDVVRVSDDYGRMS